MDENSIDSYIFCTDDDIMIRANYVNELIESEMMIGFVA